MPTTISPQPRVAVSPARDKAQVVASFDPEAFAAASGREEQWRYTPLRRIRALFEPLDEVAGADVSVTASDPELAGFGLAQGPIEIGQWLLPTDRPSALAWSLAPEITAVTVPPDTTVDEPIVVSIQGRTSSYQKLRITVESDSSATVIIDCRGSGVHAQNVEVETGPRSNLELALIAGWDRDAVALSRVHTHVGRDASVKQVVATFGGDVVRTVSTVDYDGPGGSAQLLGVAFTGAAQHHEHRLFVDHAQPRCRSSVLYKSALAGSGAHGVWVGDVLIRGSAIGTDTYEINRNLVLTPGARADSVPNLEIETGDVARAGHASATGRFDDEQLFYLRSRGIPEQAARELVVRGFLGEVLAQLPSEALRARVWAEVEARLVASGGSA